MRTDRRRVSFIAFSAIFSTSIKKSVSSTLCNCQAAFRREMTSRCCSETSNTIRVSWRNFYLRRFPPILPKIFATSKPKDEAVLRLGLEKADWFVQKAPFLKILTHWRSQSWIGKCLICWAQGFRTIVCSNLESSHSRSHIYRYKNSHVELQKNLVKVNLRGSHDSKRWIVL